jgi:hypothetical protein
MYRDRTGGLAWQGGNQRPKNFRSGIFGPLQLPGIRIGNGYCV